MTLQRRLAILTAFGLVIGAALAMLWSSSRAVVEAQQGQAGQGQTATRLADGRWLLVGGDGRSDVAALWDPGTGRPTTLAPGSLLPRSGHTATLLPDGSVLIVGGRDVNGRLIPGGDLFDPQTATFTPLPVEGGLPRTSHTATLMTDGRVLIAGGTTDQGTATADLEIWDVQPQNITNVTNPAGQLKWGRSAHTATLVGDGRVLLSGGTSADGRRVRQVEIYDPADQQVREATVAATDRTPVRVTASIPADGAHDIPIDVRPVLRFSSALRPETINGGTVSLRGPEGPVEIALVPAEGGRLVFVSPRLPLSRDTSYVLTIADAAGTGGLGVVAAQVSFVTAADNVDTAGQIDEEAWAPDAESLKKGWRSNRPDSPWEKLPPLEARPGVTALAGQVLRLDGRPLADVTLAMDGHSTRSDRTGRFLLRLDSLVSGEHELLIDARTANRPRRTYGVFEARVTITTGRTTTLPFTIWSPVLDTLHQVTIPSPTKTETVITTPLIPGLELHLPAGTVIRDHDGAVVRTIGITPIPVDRPPFPMPADAEFPVFFTIQPGGAYLHSYGASKGGWLVYPNVGGSPNGKRVQFFHYDPEDKGWYVYGMGTVTGTKVVPDAKTRIYGFTGASFNDGNTPPAEGPPPGDPAKDGDPVSLSTGIFVYEKTDLALPDVLPIGITRTYNSKDSQPRPFGRGMTHGFAIFQHSELQWEEADLILPDGGKVHYVRISAAGLPWNQTVFEHTATPTAFYKSRIAWNGANGWDLTLRDGTVYVFGHAAPLQAIRDRYGNQITVSWSAVNAFGAGTGNITRLTSPNGRWIAFTYDASNRVTQATDNLGRTVSYQYDASGRLWKVTDAAGGVTEHTYDASHRMLTIKDPGGIVYLTNEYDANGRVSRQTQADATTYEFAYTLAGGGKITQTDVTNPRGYITRTSFNASGYTTSVGEAVGTAQARTTAITRQSGTQFVERVTDGLGRHTDYTYDAKGSVTSVTRLAGTQDAVTTSYAYESTFSQLTSITDPLSHTTTLTRDVMGNVTTITDPLNHQTTVTYNAAGQPLTVTTPAGTTQFGYNLGDVVSIADPLGRTTTRFLDAAGRLLAVTNPLGQTTRYAYDPLNAIASVTDPLGGQTTFTYDGNGNLLTLTDARTNTTTYTYSSRDRVATRTDPLTRQESYAYDANGNLSQVTDRKNQVTSYAYDPLDRPTTITYHDSSTTAYTHDAGDRLTQVVDSIAGTITRAYDSLDRLTSETVPEGSVSYTYDAADRRATMTVSGQSQVTYSYDHAGRLTSIAQGSANVGFAYDSADRRTLLTLPNGVTVESGYDAASQLTSLTYKLGSNTLGDLTYTYDVAGNRLTTGGSWARTGLPAAMASATYDAANQIATWATTSFTYDNNGNLTNDATMSHLWNARNQLTGLSGGVTASFSYDGLGRRRAKTINGTTMSFFYDGLNLVQEQSGSGTPTANLLTGLGIDETFTRTDVNGTSTLLVETLGSTIALADGTGTVQTEYTFDPFGTTTTSGTTSTNATQFTGRENDGIGLYFYRARFYSPVRQRFVSEDPLGCAAGDVNFYSYVRNTPTMDTDPTGLCPACVIPWVPGAVAEAGAAAAAAAAAVTIGVELAKQLGETLGRKAACYRQWLADRARCKKLSDPQERARCYAQASERYAACLKGAPWIPPLFWPE